MDALAEIDAKLRADLGAGLDGPATAAGRVRAMGLNTIVSANGVLQERIQTTEARAAEAESKVAQGERARAELLAAHQRQVAEARRASEAAVLEAQRQAQEERTRMEAAYAEEVAAIERLNAAEREGFSALITKAEREAAEERARAAAVIGTHAARPIVSAPPARHFKYPIEVQPHKGADGRLRGFTMRSAVQKVSIEIVRDGAGEPLLMKVKPE